MTEPEMIIARHRILPILLAQFPNPPDLLKLLIPNIRIINTLAHILDRQDILNRPHIFPIQLTLLFLALSIDSDLVQHIVDIFHQLGRVL